MKRINDLLYVFNKLDFDSYLEGNDDEKNNYIKRMLKDEFEDLKSIPLTFVK